jgi:hypothetical protein
MRTFILHTRIKTLQYSFLRKLKSQATQRSLDLNSQDIRDLCDVLVYGKDSDVCLLVSVVWL